MDCNHRLQAIKVILRDGLFPSVWSPATTIPVRVHKADTPLELIHAFAVSTNDAQICGDGASGVDQLVHYDGLIRRYAHTNTTLTTQAIIGHMTQSQDQLPVTAQGHGTKSIVHGPTATTDRSTQTWNQRTVRTWVKLAGRIGSAGIATLDIYQGWNARDVHEAISAMETPFKVSFPSSEGIIRGGFISSHHSRQGGLASAGVFPGSYVPPSPDHIFEICQFQFGKWIINGGGVLQMSTWRDLLNDPLNVAGIV